MRITAIFWRTHFSGKAAIFWERRSPLFSGERRRPHFQGAPPAQRNPLRGASQGLVVTHPSKPHKINTKVVNFCLTRGASHIKGTQELGRKISTKLLVIFIS